MKLEKLRNLHIIFTYLCIKSKDIAKIILIPTIPLFMAMQIKENSIMMKISAILIGIVFTILAISALLGLAICLVDNLIEKEQEKEREKARKRKKHKKER